MLTLVVASSLAILAPSGTSAPHTTVMGSNVGPTLSATTVAPSTSFAPSIEVPAALSASDSHHPPGEITGGMGWEGIDYRDTCAGCVPADPQLAVGAGYVLELVNGSERVWLVNGTQVHNESVDSLFDAGSDEVVSAQVQFDLFADRWFITAADLTTDQLLLGASLSSDPTADWTVESIAPANGSVARQPLLAVDSDNVVVTTNDFSPNGTFQGAQVWATNKTALLEGGSALPVAVDAADPTTEALVPAAPLSRSSTMYLVDDELGGNDSLHLFSLTGSPPGAVSLSGPMNFTTNTSAPPNALQSGTSDLLGVGDGRIDSAAWRSDTLWAVAAVACTPAGDSQNRSCLHLWEVNTATDELEQDFTWSSGPGTYDFDPALSIATRGDVALVFGESSPTLDPSFLATGQAVTGPFGTLATPIVLHNGTAPYDPAVGCAAGVCPFGSDFAIASTPSTNVHFWAVGEYAPANSTKNFWKTWVNQVAAWATVPVTFSESGLPAGTPWSVTVNGALEVATNSSLTVDEQNGSYTYTVLSPIAGGPGVRYLASSSAGTFTVAAASVQVNVVYLAQYQLTSSAGPQGGGSVYPGGSWLAAGSTLSLSALADAGYEFEAWSGSGSGSYSGSANPASVTVGSPIVEEALFWVAATYPVSFTESGLPSGASWTVTANGLSNSSSGPTILFNEPNGTYTFTLSTPVPWTAQTSYVGTPASGSLVVAGAPGGARVTYTAEFELSASLASPGTGVVNPSGGWFLDGTAVNVSALAGPGELFVGWTGSGVGSYTGPANPAPVVVDSPVGEVARFAPATTYPITYTESGLPPGAEWSVTTNGVRATSSAPSVVFNEPNGSYSFGAATSFTAANGTTYAATPAFGTFVIAGAGMHEAIEFGPTTAPTPAPGTATTASSSTGIPLWVFAALLGALVIVVLILTYASRRPPVTPPTSAPSLPLPRADWDESG